MNDDTTQTTINHSPSYELYLAFVLLLDQLAYVTTNFWPSSLSCVNIAFNLKLFQLVCNLIGHPQMGCLKMGIDES